MAAMRSVMEFEDAMQLYKQKLTGSDPVFRLSPPRPSASQSHRQDETWYLRDEEGRLIARVSRLGVRLA